MPRLTDQPTIDAIVHAFEEAACGCGGYVGWTQTARENLARHFPGFTQKLVEELVSEHLAQGGEIIRANEKREYWRDRNQFHYDFVLNNPEGGRQMYVESVIVNDELSDASVMIVNCHYAD